MEPSATFCGHDAWDALFAKPQVKWLSTMLGSCGYTAMNSNMSPMTCMHPGRGSRMVRRSATETARRPMDPQMWRITQVCEARITQSKWGHV